MDKLIHSVILEAGDIALQFRSRLDSIQVTRKGAKDLVTEADIAVENHIRSQLSAATPEFGFLGEESPETEGKTSRWIVDPIRWDPLFYPWAVLLEYQHRLGK